MEKVTKYIDLIISWVMIITFILVPCFFLPFTQNYYLTNKLLLLAVSSVLLLCLWGLKIIITRRLILPKDPSLPGVIALAGSALLALILTSNNRIESLIAPTGLIVFLSLFIIIFTASSVLNANTRKIFQWCIFGGYGTLGLIAIYQYFGIGKLMFPTVAFLADPMWSPTGSPLATLIMLLILLPVMIESLIIETKKKNEMLISVASMITLITGAGAIIILIQLIPNWKFQTLPISESWRILLEAFKNPLSALFGVGPENYQNAFTAGRSVLYNSYPIWNIRFTSASNNILHLITTLGFAGLFAFVLFIRPILHKLSEQPIGLRLSLLLMTLGLIFAPQNIVLYCLALSLLLFKNHENKGHEITIPGHISWVAYALGITTLVFAIGSSYFIYRYYKGEFLFIKSLQAAEKNDGLNTYNLQIFALVTNPYITQYHITYGQTNLALANSIAAKPKSATDSAQGSSSLSENDRQLISQLLQQSIRETKTAINLSPNNVAPWESLANIYRNIMGVVTGADQWTIASYQRAIQLDPINPLIRFDLGGIYITLADYDNAIRLLQESIALKSDIPNTYYNLAFAFRQKKLFLSEAQALAQALKLIPPEATNEIDKVTQELEAAKAKLTKEELAIFEGKPVQEAENTNINNDLNQTELTQPEPQPEPQITPKIDLPQSNSPEDATTPFEQTETPLNQASQSASPTTSPQL